MAPISERKRQKAATKIQCAYRCYIARKNSREAYRSQYVFAYDERERQYMYRNKRTLEKSSQKPKFFRNRKDDLPKQNNLEAPADYNNGIENTSKGYLLLVTSNEFPLGKWTGLDGCTQLDHDYLYNIFSHDFIGKFRPENIHSLKNPTTLEFTDSMVKLRKCCAKDSFLIVYISTHVMSIVKGEKNNKNETSYFVFRNSVWDTPVETAESCISLTTFTQLLNRIASKQKTVFINYAHIPRPRATLFPNAKIIYPPNNFLTRLATLGKCAVIASCSTGTRARELLKQSPIHIDKLVLPPVDTTANNLIPTKKIKLAEEQKKQALDAEKRRQEMELAKEARKFKSEERHTTRFSFLGGFSSSHQQVKKTNKNETDHLNKHAAAHPSIHVNEQRALILSKLQEDWCIVSPPHIVYSERPVKPSATWKRDEQTGDEIAIVLPDIAQRKSHMRRLTYWKVKTTLAMPVNFVRRNYRKYKKYSMMAPCQTSLTDEGQTLFGRALYYAISGGACSPDNEIVTIHDIFKYMHNYIKNEIARLRVEAENHSHTGTNDEEAAVVATKLLNQSPVLVLPAPPRHIYHSQSLLEHEQQWQEEYLLNPVCYRVGPPAAPDKPYIVHIGNNEVLLEWYNPPFAGVPPTKYKVYMRNKSRNYNMWREVYYPGDILKTQFLVRNLPMGIACQFRVSAWNTGGWGQLSAETIYVIPGEENEQISDEVKWKRIQQGGVLGVYDYITLHSKNATEQVKGLRMMISFAHNSTGFKNAAQSLEIAEHCLNTLKIFEKNPEIHALCYEVLGWCIRNKSERKVRKYCLEHDLLDLVAKSTLAFRRHDKVMNALSWLHGAMPKYIPIPEPVLVYIPLNPVPKPKKKFHDDSESEEEEYEDGDDDENEGQGDKEQQGGGDKVEEIK